MHCGWRTLILLGAMATNLVPWVKGAIPSFSDRSYDVFIYAGLYTLIIMIIGYGAANVMRDTPAPNSLTLVLSLVIACILAALTLFPQITAVVEGPVPGLRTNRYFYP